MDFISFVFLCAEKLRELGLNNREKAKDNKLHPYPARTGWSSKWSSFMAVKYRPIKRQS